MRSRKIFAEKLKYMLLTFLLAAVFIAGSMFCVSSLLKHRENRLLNGIGTMEQQSPVRGGMKSEKREKAVLENAEIQAVVEQWSRRIGNYYHEPVEGQITMKEAVKAVDEWLPKIGLSEGILSGNSSVRSTLNVAQIKGEKMPEALSPIYSYWQVLVTGDELEGSFYVNAVTGQIWEAELTLHTEIQEKEGKRMLNSFILLAGLKPEEQNSVEAGLSAMKDALGVAVDVGLISIELAAVDSPAKISVYASSASDGAAEKEIQHWSVSGNIMDSDMVAMINCSFYTQYIDVTDVYSKTERETVSKAMPYGYLAFKLISE